MKTGIEPLHLDLIKLQQMFIIQTFHCTHLSAAVLICLSETLCNLLQRMLGSPTRVMNKFPNLTGTPNLELIHLDGLNLETIPDDLCSAASKLHTL